MLLTDFLVFFDEGFFDEGFGVLRVDEPDRRAVDFETLFATFFRLLGRFLAAAFFAGIAPASNDGLNGTGDYT